MLIELIVAAFIAAYVAVVALGHVLLVAAICKYLRDSAGGRGRKVESREQEAAAGDAAPRTATRFARGATRSVAAGSVIRLVRPDVEHPQHS
jgi:hypothetical protein